jgi:trehalose 6-phosphate phosphatase
VAADPFRVLRLRPKRSAVLLDFDGTLAPIVDDPEAARLLEGVADVLRRLSERFALVGVVSGRPVDFLAKVLPGEVAVSGLYGLELARDGERSDHAQAGAWREVVADVAASSDARGPAGMHVENKGLSLTLHYRTHPELAAAVRRWADSQAARSGLRVRAAKMSVELHPPVDADKGSALIELSRTADLRAAIYVGDDLGDLPAFTALDQLATEGVHIVRVAVAGPETPAELIEAADVVVEGPSGVLELLASLADG